MPFDKHAITMFTIVEDDTCETGTHRRVKTGDGGLSAGADVLVWFPRAGWTRCHIVRVDLWRIHISRKNSVEIKGPVRHDVVGK